MFSKEIFTVFIVLSIFTVVAKVYAQSSYGSELFFQFSSSDARVTNINHFKTKK